ncbi:MAG: hypothetical protein ABSC18_18060 [Verrucomicrobiota bacterium]
MLYHDGKAAASQLEPAAEEAGFFTRNKFSQPSRGTEWKREETTRLTLNLGGSIQTGEFGADMAVSLTNDGLLPHSGFYTFFIRCQSLRTTAAPHRTTLSP